MLVLPLLGALELALSWRAWWRLLAAGGGFVVGSLPEVMVIARRHGLGWAALTSKAEQHAQRFPAAFLESIAGLADQRVALLAAWALAVACAAAWLVRSVRRGEWRAEVAPSAAAAPVALGVVTGPRRRPPRRAGGHGAGHFRCLCDLRLPGTGLCSSPC